MNEGAGSGTAHEPSATRQTRVTVVLKTAQGGMWIIPQVLAMRSRGAAVCVILPASPGRLRSALQDIGIPVLDSPFDFSFRPRPDLVRRLWALRRTIDETKPDVVFYHLYASALAARLATAGRSVRRVHMVAGPLYLENALIRLAERFLCRFDDRIIAGSEYSAHLYARLGYPRRQLLVVPYGVDVQKFRKDSTPAPISEEFVAIMVAYVYAPKSAVFPGVGIKGHEVLLEAWRRFSARHQGVRLLLIGGGFDPAGEEYRGRLLERYGDLSTLTWLESVTDVRPSYARAHVSVSPSLSENHGAALEASSMGLPSIVSRVGGLPEVVDPDIGWLVPPGDVEALERALDHAYEAWADGRLAEMGASARRRMEERFDGRTCATNVALTVLTGGTS